MQTNCRRLSRDRAGLVVVDIQERLLPAMADKERLLRNSATLLRTAAILHLPVFVSEQYRKGLGPTVPELAAAVSNFSPFQKVRFSACGAEGFVAALQSAGVSDVVLCGIEAHVCVTQTCLDLLDAAFGVFVVADATSSRTHENHRFGIERMRDAGAAIVSTEMAIFELLQGAGTEDFRQVLPVIK